MKKAIIFFGFAYGLLACGAPSEKTSAEYLDLPDPRTTPEIGKVLYLRHCAACHPAVKSDNMLADRVRSAQGSYSELQKFIRSQDSLLKAGDAYTLELNKKWGAQIYRHHFTLTDAELKALFYYLETTF